MTLDFIDDFDRDLAEGGPPAIFTINNEGVLQLDPMRTRDFRKQNTPPFRSGTCHCVLVDHATGWPQYALITSAGLSRNTRAEVLQFPDPATALAEVRRRKEKLYEEHSR